MFKTPKILSLTVMALAFGACFNAARAEVFVWQDPASGARLSFPDRWGTISNQNPGDVVTIRAPGDNEFAECRMNIQPEGRFKIYPAAYDTHIQKLYVSRPYWDEFFATNDDVTLGQVTDNAGLGRGFASYATASYRTSKGAIMNKQAIAFASYYNKRIYTVECSAEESSYEKWAPAFMSVIKSVDFKQANPATTGYYRDFLSDRPLKIRGASVLEDTYH